MAKRQKQVEQRNGNGSQIIPRWLTIGIVVASMFVWLLSLVWSASHPDYDIPPSVHAVVILVLTAVLGGTVVQRRD